MNELIVFPCIIYTYINAFFYIIFKKNRELIKNKITFQVYLHKRLK